METKEKKPIDAVIAEIEALQSGSVLYAAEVVRIFGFAPASLSTMVRKRIFPVADMAIRRRGFWNKKTLLDEAMRRKASPPKRGVKPGVKSLKEKD